MLVLKKVDLTIKEIQIEDQLEKLEILIITHKQMDSETKEDKRD
jgi:hypothetical protein